MMFSKSTRGSDSGNRARWNKVSRAAQMQVQQSSDMRITLFLIIAFHPILSYDTIDNVLWFPFRRRRNMSHKTFTQAAIVVLMALALFAVPISANAGGTCGSTYTVQSGDTLGSISEICGTTVYDLYNANPGIGGTLYAGQVLTIPSSSSNYNNDNYNNYNGYNSNGYNNNPNNYNYAPTNAYGTTYVIQPGDTFGDIANRYGVSINDLSNANPYIGNEDLLYPGQVINIPAPPWPAPTPVAPWYPPQSQPAQPGYGYAPTPAAPWYPYQPQPRQPWYGSYPPPSWHGYYGYVPTPTEITTPLAYGQVSPGSPTVGVQLSNEANAKVYVSLQGTARDGTNVIREYPVSGTFSVTIPAGYYNYVAWVGGKEFSGAINLPGHSYHSITFHSNEVDAQ
jgi:LysM repeat protein